MPTWLFPLQSMRNLWGPSLSIILLRLCQAPCIAVVPFMFVQRHCCGAERSQSCQFGQYHGQHRRQHIVHCLESGCTGEPAGLVHVLNNRCRLLACQCSIRFGPHLHALKIACFHLCTQANASIAGSSTAVWQANAAYSTANSVRCQ